jgi:energy-converting hydrogenase Eha subunit A
VPAMTSQRILVRVATAQLAAQLVGLSVAVRRGLPYDVRVVGMRGEADDVVRDLWDKGTALSAPVTMLGTQAVAIALVATNPDASVGRVAAKVLGGLGALNIGGYLGERVVRERLRPNGWDHVETPVAVVSLALATAMAALGLGRVEGR